ncbi:hypothetical protein PybrP1_012883 [[Pythium] brassicae (nom. inval.)]|nr:hypothetical protein PybrP1_012883 [[Pythium] brassicae (nom. inval.)]
MPSPVQAPASDDDSDVQWENCQELLVYLLGAGIPVNIADNSGWTPLLEAAQEGQIPNCEVLLANGATPDLAAAGDMTPLRAAVKVGNEEMAKWLLKQPGSWPRRWDNAFFALLLHKTPAAAVEYLDTFAVVQNHSKLGNAAVHYSDLRFIYGEPNVPVEETALGAAASSQNGKHVLSHRVLRHVMKAKWQSFAKGMFRREFTVYCTLVASYYVPTIWADPNWVQLASKFDYWVACCRAVSWVSSLYLLLNVEYHEFKGTTGGGGGGGARAYFGSFWNVLNFTSYVATMVTIPLEFIASLAEERDCLLALVTVTLWVNLLQFLQVTTHSGLLLAMMSRMRRDVFRFFILYGVFLLGFSGAFYLLLRGRTGFESYRAAFLTVLLMLFGGLEYDTFGGTSGWTWHVANALLFVYLLAAVVVLLNILIAMMATTYGDIWDAAEAETMLCHAQAIVRMEAALSSAARERTYRALLLRGPATAGEDPAELALAVQLERPSSTQGLRSHLSAKKAMAASIVAKMKAMPAQALASSPTWSAVKPLAPSVNLTALKEALFLKSTFDEDSSAGDAGEPPGDDRRALGLLDDGVRYEAPLRPHAEPKQEAELLLELQAQVQQLSALVKELGSSAVAPVPPRRRKSLVRYASPVDLV